MTRIPFAGGISGSVLIAVVTQGERGALWSAALFFCLGTVHLLARSLAQVSLLELTQGAVLRSGSS